VGRFIFSSPIKECWPFIDANSYTPIPRNSSTQRGDNLCRLYYHYNNEYINFFVSSKFGRATHSEDKLFGPSTCLFFRIFTFYNWKLQASSRPSTWRTSHCFLRLAPTRWLSGPMNRQHHHHQWLYSPDRALASPYGFSWWSGMYDVRLSASRSTWF
jgi:hypothetical protein